VKNEAWIEKLRVLATIAVILIHVVQGTYVNGISGIPLYRCIFDTSLLMSLTSWAVPVFVMITGYLLLNPEKDLPIAKLKKYIGRMLLILATLGLGYCVIESFMKAHEKGLLFVCKDAVIHLLSGKSWSHMWYVYMLIGLYVLTPVLRAFVKEASGETVRFVMVCLFLLTILCPTINRALGSSLTNFYVFSFPYVFYYLFGYYATKLKPVTKFLYIIGFAAFAVCVLCSSLQPAVRHAVFEYDSAMLAVLAMSIFLIAFRNKEKEIKNKKLAAAADYIAKSSFCIYLVHPVFLNVLNKGFHVYITQFPIILGEFLFFIVAFCMSLLTYMAAKRIFH